MSISISPLDTVVLLIYLAGVVLVGVWVGRGKKTLDDYLLGGRQLPWWALLGSIVATETSTATFLSVPGLAFREHEGDLRFLQLPLGFFLGRVLVAFVLLPHYFRGDLYSAYQVLHRRFGGATRTTASGVFLVMRNVADGLRLYLAAIVLERVAGFSLTTSIITLGLVTIAYTMIGGMKSVVWNDCVQLVIYIAGALLAVMVMLRALPEGLGQVIDFGTAEHKWQVFDFRFDPAEPFTFWAGLLGGMFLSMGTHGADQMMVQRYLCARSRREAARALVLSGLVVLLQFALFLFVGVTLAAFYVQYPPLTAFRSDDEVFATFIVNHMPQGLTGITLAAVFAAAMSTLSSSLNSSAAAALDDFLLRDKQQILSPAAIVRRTQLLTLVFGVIQIALGLAGRYFAANVVSDVLAIAGFTTGILLGVFFLGVLTRHVEQRAALVGLVGGLLLLTWLKFGPQFYELLGIGSREATSGWRRVHLVAWPYYSIIGSGATFTLGLLAQQLMRSGRAKGDRAGLPKPS